MTKAKSNLLKMFRPMLMVAPDGKLVIHIAQGGCSVWRPAPDDFAKYRAEAVHAYLNEVVPLMIDELKALRKNKLEKLKRKGTNESNKRRHDVNGHDFKSDERIKASTDGSP